jgi:hypothetical protein
MDQRGCAQVSQRTLRSAGNRAFEKPIALCEEYGFRPPITQDASHWLTILLLIGACLGVPIAPRLCAPHRLSGSRPASLSPPAKPTQNP